MKNKVTIRMNLKVTIMSGTGPLKTQLIVYYFICVFTLLDPFFRFFLVLYIYSFFDLYPHQRTTDTFPHI